MHGSRPARTVEVVASQVDLLQRGPGSLNIPGGQAGIEFVVLQPEDLQLWEVARPCPLLRQGPLEPTAVSSAGGFKPGLN